MPIPQSKYLLPVDGELKNDRDYVANAHAKIRYNACPETMEVLDTAAKPPSSLQFNIVNLNYRNCSGWVCQVLRKAEVDPLNPIIPKLFTHPSTKLAQNSCETPGLGPVNLTVAGEIDEDILGYQDTLRRFIQRKRVQPWW
jgi:hypothetical protein